MDCLKKGLSFVAACMLVSCVGSIGVKETPVDRYQYNLTLQYSDIQQDLLNVVRLRYNDPPYFLTVNSIVSQFDYTKTLSLPVTLNEFYVQPAPYVIPTVTPGLSFSDRPTVTFTPLQGTEFVTRFMTPVDLSVLYMFLRSGWGISHILRPLLEQVGPIDATKTASRVTSSRIPNYRTFLTLTNALRKLQHADALVFHALNEGKKYAIRFDIKSFAGLDKKEMEALRLLNATPETPYFSFVSQPSPDPHEILVHTRNVLGILNYFSKGVDVPKEDVINHRVPMTFYPDGRPFDWHNVTGKLFRVHVCSKLPKSGVYAAIQYKGKFFYIAESDFETKESLILITTIMGIYEGKVEGFLPVFTVSA